MQAEIKPLCIDLFCGLGGWAEGFLAEGYRCVGYDIEAHDYGTGGYPGELIIRDVRSVTGAECKEAAVIVASPPCQAYSYRAMPWKRAKALPPPDNTLFNECFRIQREASEAAGRYIPLIVENVRGAQKWVGRARWNYGSFYLWGDVPALMPPALKVVKSLTGGGRLFRDRPDTSRWSSWHDYGEGYNQRPDGIKQPGICGVRENGKGDAWFQDGAARHGSRSAARKAASALIAKIPFPLAQHIARTFKPHADLRAAG